MFEAHLPPADVPTKERYVSTIGDERFDSVPHFLRPILVVTNADKPLVVVHHLWIRMKINTGTVLQGDVVALRPDYEALFSKCIKKGNLITRAVKGNRDRSRGGVETAAS